MNTGLISSRYADSLLQYAVSLGQQEEVYDKMKLLSEMFMKMPRLRSAIINPSLPGREKKKILVTACGGGMPSSLSKMIDLILKNEREEALQYIALRFIDLYREKFDIQSGRLVTAISIDHETEQQLVTRIQKMVKTNVEMESVTDPGIIGGFILTLGDFRWDASISGELARIRNKFRKGLL
ncbi:F0F1 ATP synthase subunit delta [Proteiniphilum acetatigenes]|uniref:F0F1 ATP synthase subunit delta n=1 Tax=Proteiniphilum acetatigenes TaxID=294710 RepID=UPI000372ADC6|nr:F0F1 ATP synthase subunit delta [Proteiniphilum acetatigenes]SFK94486.1 ATP synthase F1 subcomplex delta subunit [Porphyromonadaceae bacterium KH3CP3RA]